MAEDYQRLLQEISDLKRQMANTFQVGTVHEVKGDKLRMVVGKTKDGKEVLSPWLNTSNHRGGATEARFYKKGQTLGLICPGGDLAQGMIAPYAPNKNFKRPEHANESSDGEESYQLENYRQKQSTEGVDMWLQDGDGGGDSKGHVGGESAKVKTRLNAEGGITHRVGKDNRLAAHERGVKMRVKSDYVVIYKPKKGPTKLIMSRPPNSHARSNSARRQVKEKAMAVMRATPQNPILQKFYVYDPGIVAGDEFGGLRVIEDEKNDNALHVLAARPMIQYWIDQGLAGGDPPSKLGEKSKRFVGQLTRGRSENPDVEPVRVPRYSRETQSGAPTFAGTLAAPTDRMKKLAKDRKKDKNKPMAKKAPPKAPTPSA